MLKPSLTNRYPSSGFTIVELLIVIVIIGILAAITIIAFNGVRDRAVIAELQSNLANATKKLELYKFGQSGSEVYPSSLDCSASPVANSICIPAESGLTYQYTYTAGTNSYCLSAVVGTTAYYRGSSDTAPISGVCAGHISPLAPTPNGGVVAAIAGSGSNAFANGTGAAAAFNFPYGITTDSTGTSYVADTGNNLIRKVTSAGVVTTFAGTGAAGYLDATGTAAILNAPRGVAIDSSGNLFVADTNGHKIRKITFAGVVTTIAGSGTAGFANGTGAAAQFNYPGSIAVSASGDLFVSDTDNERIRKVTQAGVVTTIAGSGVAGFANGTGAAAQFDTPYGIAVTSNGDLLVADIFNHRIRKVTQAGVVTTFAGSGTAAFADGTGTSAQLNRPFGVAVDSTDTAYVADQQNHRIRKITSAGVVTTLAGTGTIGQNNGAGASATFSSPFGISVQQGSTTLYVTEAGTATIRKVQ